MCTKFNLQIFYLSASAKKFGTIGAHIKYVGQGAGGFYIFFKNFVAQETIDLNIS